MDVVGEGYELYKSNVTLTHAGMNKDSDWFMNEALKDPGFHLNRKDIKKQFITNSTRLKIITTTPIILNQSDRYGTATNQSRTSISFGYHYLSAEHWQFHL